ncbi:MAG: ABC transporter substrate-binding protein [Pseudomonadota bacterium]
MRLGFGLALVYALLAGCGDAGKVPEPNSDGLIPVILQTDWYAQPEHGGFYQAQAKGFYAEEGLDVEIRPGANLNTQPQMVALGRVQFSVGAIETLFMHRSRNIPLVSLFPYFQHDPQCILFHKESGIETLQDLDGREVMISPGSVYTDFLQQAMGLELQLIPMDWSLARFMAEKTFIQQCFLTSEPVTLRRQGIDAGVIPMSESGFDPYRHVYTNEALAEQQPELVKGFIRASLRGWRDFMEGDPSPAFEAIMASNPQQNLEVMADILEQMKTYQLTEGKVDEGEELGQYNLARIRRVLSQLEDLGLLGTEVTLEDSIATGLLPQELLVDRPLP